MKKIFIFICLHLWTIFLFVSVSAQEFKTIQDGIEYAETTRGTKNAPIRVNLLKLDLTKVRLDVVHAMDAAIGVEKTSSIATRHGAIAAINAGFFRLDSSIFAGDAVGVLQIDGKVLSESQNDRIAIGIINGKDKTEVDFAHVETDIWFISFTDRYFDISGINRERKKEDAILYTPEFHRTTLTNADGTELVYECEPCKKKTIYQNKGSNVIAPNGFVVSFGKDYDKGIVELFKKQHLGAWSSVGAAAYSIEKEKSFFFSKAEDITNGVPQLIKNGRVEITWEQEKAAKAFVENKHPRTAVAKLKDGKFLMVTVDGRSLESVGMNLQELAEFLLELGAVDAMNLDGGGSTTMFLDGKIVNKPSDKEGERKVSDAILVTLRKKN